MSVADATPAWAAWSSVMPVMTVPGTQPRYLRVIIPQRIAPDADGNFPDLRVIDDRANEIPFAIDPPVSSRFEYYARIIDRGFVPGSGAQVVLDLGWSHELVDRIRVDVNGRAPATFFERVVVDASDDRIVWRTTDESLIFRVERDGKYDLTIPISPTRSRWLRLRVGAPLTPFSITGAEVSRGRQSYSHTTTIGSAKITPSSSGHSQSWTFQFLDPVRPTAVRFASANVPFSRAATVESSDDGGRTWTSAGSGTITRFADGASSPSVWFTAHTARDWRVTVENGNDRALTSLMPQFLSATHEIVFADANGSRYRILSGNPTASTPTYDLRAQLAYMSWSARTAAVGETVPNSAYRDPRPIGERFPWLVSAALIIAALALGAIAVRTIRITGAT